MPFAPGTWGSVVGLVFAGLFPFPPVISFIIIAVGFMAGVVAAGAAERVIGEQDSGHIIVDEFIGYLVSIYALPHSWTHLIAAFLLFRVFDILKPFPIGRLEKRLSGGLGIMADDLLAGIFANILLQVSAWTRIF